MRKKVLFISVFLIITVLSACFNSEKNAITYIDNETSKGVTIPDKGMGASYIDDEISKRLVKKTDAYDKEIVNSIVTRNYEYILENFNPNAELEKNHLLDYLNSCSEIIIENEYEHFARYHFITVDIPQASRAVTDSSDGEYNIITDTVDGEIFISLITYKYAHVEELLIIQYIKEDNEWYINNIIIGPYSYNGNNAEYHYEKAKAYYNAEEYLMAYLHINTAIDLRVDSYIFRYKSIIDMEDLAEMCVERMNEKYKIPTEIEDRLVYFFSPVNAPGAMIPCFHYATKYEMTADEDPETSEKISAEIQLMHSELMKRFPEIPENFDMVMYYAVSNPGGDGPAYREVVEIEKNK